MRGLHMLRFERYGFAVVAVGAALLYRLLLAPMLDEPESFVLFPLAVLVSAWRGGLGPGLLASLLALSSVDYFLLEPRFSLGPDEAGQASRLALFALECLGVTAIGAHARRRVRSLGDPEKVRAAQEMRTRAERFRRLLDVGPVGVIGLDDKGAVTFWNARAARLFGWTEDDVLGRDLAGLILPVAERDAWREQRERFLKTGTGEPAGRIERRLLRRDRSEVAADATVVAQRVEESWEFTLFVVDLTDRQRSEEAARLAAEERWRAELAREQQARREAEADARLRDEFMATLSHELRTPLSAIVGWAHLLRTGNLEPKDRVRAVETIDRSAKSQAQLIADILDISSIVTGKLRITPEPVRLQLVVHSAAETVRPAADAKGVRVEAARGEADPVVHGDANRLQQVVLNLLSNAVKFTPRGKAVHVAVTATDEEAVVEVRDEGRGIAPEFLPHVFERFRQAEEGGTERGLGLGLAIVRHLVELHGGTVQAASDGAGQGARLTVRLPLYRAAEQDAQTPARPTAIAAEPSLEGVRVLVVDDDEDVRGMMQAVLSERGAQVQAAASAGEALDAAQREPPDVLVSDLAMPEMDGYALLRELRGRPETPPIPAAAVTAYARPEDRKQALLAGFQMHVAKPIEPDELVAVVASLAGKTGE